MAKCQLPTIELLRQLLRYELGTGKLSWKERPASMFFGQRHSVEHSARKWNARYSGSEAFTSRDHQGYGIGKVNGRMVKAHRVVWALVNGEWPNGDIDHINGNVSDNRIENLRIVDKAENNKNQKLPRNNTSGVIGVFWNKKEGKWEAQIKVNRKRHHLGTFASLSDAAAARKAAEIKFGFHANHGRAA